MAWETNSRKSLPACPLAAAHMRGVHPASSTPVWLHPSRFPCHVHTECVRSPDAMAVQPFTMRIAHYSCHCPWSIVQQAITDPSQPSAVTPCRHVLSNPSTTGPYCTSNTLSARFSMFPKREGAPVPMLGGSQSPPAGSPACCGSCCASGPSPRRGRCCRRSPPCPSGCQSGCRSWCPWCPRSAPAALSAGSPPGSGGGVGETPCKKKPCSAYERRKMINSLKIVEGNFS